MPTPRLSLPLTLAALGLGALSAAGCGNDSGAESPAKTATTATATATTATTESAATAATAATASTTSIAVALTEWKVTPSRTTAAAGHVTFDVHNGGAQPHELVVLKSSKPAARLGKAGTARLPETGHVGEVGELKAGADGKTTIDLKPGRYALICNLPGHWTAGMRSDLTVR
jgi:uncharacterized cupredoxin-like copper-binding protein